MYWNGTVLYLVNNLKIIYQQIKIDDICNLYFYKFGEIKILNITFEKTNTIEISGSDNNYGVRIPTGFEPNEENYLVQFICPLALINKQLRFRLFNNGSISLGAFPKISIGEIGTFQMAFSFCYY